MTTAPVKTRPSSDVPPPFLVALNLTRKCNLRCEHCYLDAGTRLDGADGELTTDEVKRALDGIASLSDETMVVFTGGEPALRRDLEEMIAHATKRGLMPVLGTNGTLLDDARILALKQAGLQGAGISVDSLDPAHHDAFRGSVGSWEKAMGAIDACRRHRLRFQIHFSVTEDNAHELDDMIDFAKAAKAFVLNVFFLVCTGRGEKFTGVSAETYERVLRRVTEAAHDEQGLIVRAKCAPHFKRMALELDPAWPVTAAHGYEAGGCLAGTRYFRVTPEAKVTACPYMEAEVGDLRKSDVVSLWHDAAGFKALREPKLEGRCGACEYAKLCGGCRARPLARDDNLMGEDFLCAYEPKGGAVIEPMPDSGAALQWTDEAQAWLQRIPSFVRRFVRKRAEDRVRADGGVEVTAEIIGSLARERFKGRGSGMQKRMREMMADMDGGE
ncbi:MAG: radical SAM protein [Rhodospirillaceae bacterium]|nr:radical SAM protein [Rhodospirillaceae bacterium]